MEFTQQIWLEVANVRIENKEEKKEVSVQLKGDKTDREPVWWPVSAAKEKEDETYRNIAEGLDKKRTVLASLQRKEPKGAEAESLHVRYVRVQHTDSSAR